MSYDEDPANSQVNQNTLEQEFNINTSEDRRLEIESIRDMRKQLMTVSNEPDADSILISNIERANSLLDVAQNSIINGGETNARLFEVCSQLINAITSASTSLQNSTFGTQKHQYNMKMVEVKEQELLVKQAIAQGKLDSYNKEKNKKSNGTLVVMNREELLRMIEKEDTEVEITSTDKSNSDQE